MKEVVFVHKIPIGNLSPQRAKQLIADRIELYKIELKTAEAKNIFIPIKDGDGSVECIYSGEGQSIFHEELKTISRSDILIDKFVSDMQYHSLMNKETINEEIIFDAKHLKKYIDVQIYEDQFSKAFKEALYDKPIVKNKTPLGIVSGGHNMLYFLDFEKKSIISFFIKKSDLCKYLYFIELFKETNTTI